MYEALFEDAEHRHHLRTFDHRRDRPSRSMCCYLHGKVDVNPRSRFTTSSHVAVRTRTGTAKRTIDSSLWWCHLPHPPTSFRCPSQRSSSSHDITMSRVHLSTLKLAGFGQRLVSICDGPSRGGSSAGLPEPTFVEFALVGNANSTNFSGSSKPRGAFTQQARPEN